MSSETEDSDRALKPGPHSNLLYLKKKIAREEAVEGRGKGSVMDNGTLHTETGMLRHWTLCDGVHTATCVLTIT